MVVIAERILFRHGIDSRGCFKRERSSLVASVVETIVVLVEFVVVVVFQTLHAF